MGDHSGTPAENVILVHFKQTFLIMVPYPTSLVAWTGH
jgi:hypothetical protein